MLITLTGLSAVIGLGSSYTIQELSRFFLLWKEENYFSSLKLFFSHHFGERSIDQPARAACAIKTLNVLSYNSKTLSLGHCANLPFRYSAQSSTR